MQACMAIASLVALFTIFEIQQSRAIQYRPDAVVIHTRGKRQGSLATAYGWTPADVELIVDEHNRLRRLVPASDMQLLYWDDYLASSAQAHANRCMFAHSANRVNTGENIWASPFSNYRGAFQMWFNEVYDKRCSCTNTYKYCCGHYTQVAWATTSRVGCGYAKCNSVTYLPGYFHYVLVCHYNPAGNFIGRPGFTYRSEGEQACSRCPPGHRCVDGLCAWY